MAFETQEEIPYPVAEQIVDTVRELLIEGEKLAELNRAIEYGFLLMNSPESEESNAIEYIDRITELTIQSHELATTIALRMGGHQAEIGIPVLITNFEGQYTDADSFFKDPKSKSLRPSKGPIPVQAIFERLDLVADNPYGLVNLVSTICLNPGSPLDSGVVGKRYVLDDYQFLLALNMKQELPPTPPPLRTIGSS